MKKKHIIKTVIVSLEVLAIIFIFANSMPDIESSKATSKKVAGIVRPMLELIFGSGNVTDHLVRKLAHLTEFAGFGFVISLFFGKFKLAPFFISLIVALTDETIQIYTGRGPQVQDVWIDFIGACIGICVGVCIINLYRYLKRKLNERKVLKSK